MPEHKDGWQIVLPVFVGIAALLLFAGPNVLLVDNIAWLTRGDAPQHYLGWAYFRGSDWSFPIGLNPNYGLELGSAIVYSDSIPILAIFFKIFDAILPETFQYFGIWLLICYTAQAVLSWKLIGLFSNDAIIRLLGVGFFVSSPPMINRMTQHISNVAHLTLVGHFLILAALYLFLRPMRAHTAVHWLLLLAIAAMVHAYLFGMVAIFWFADLVRSVSRKERTRRSAVGHFLGAVTLVLLVSWQIGVFSVGDDITAGGYGHYNLNLLSLISASGWSYLLPDIPGYGGSYEGFNFLGLGGLILAGFAWFGYRKSDISPKAYLRQERALFVTVVSITAFAVSNTIAAGPFGFSLPFPEPFSSIAKIFRSSGRMFWPVYYLVFLGLIFIVVRSFSRKMAPGGLAVALAIQVADTSAAWIPIRSYFAQPPASQWQTSLTDPFWDKAAKRYGTLRLLPPRNAWGGWSDFAAFAQRNHMPTDVVYMARYGDRKFDPYEVQAIEDLEKGKFEPSTLYLVQAEHHETAQANLDKSIDLIADIDGVTVIAPGWMSCINCLAVFDPKMPNN